MRTFAIALAGVLFATSAAAESKAVDQTANALKGTGRYGAAGCGLGSMAFGDQAGPIQILAATTNYLPLPWQMFGITTGTSNCGPGAFAQGTKNFVEANREALAKDVSRGEGDAIGALTVINACDDSRKVGAVLQKNFKVIFPTDDTSNDRVTQAILDTLHADKSLGCGHG